MFKTHATKTFTLTHCNLGYPLHLPGRASPTLQQVSHENVELFP